ncbi:MAG: efflux RND transporter periplasmic adaptor subunit [Vicinamibacterales bacterium]
MDVVRPASTRQRYARRAVYAVAALVVTGGGAVALGRLKPAVPGIDAASVWSDTVRRGQMVREVRGLGTLVPEEQRWITASTEARVDEIVLRPGTQVRRDTVILRLSNPQVEQQLQDAQLRVQSAEASLANARVQVQNELLEQRASAASVEAEYTKLKMQADMNDALAGRGLVSDLLLRQLHVDADQLAIRNQIAQEQLASRAESGRAQLAVQESAVNQARALLDLVRRQRDDLSVRAGLDGVLQLVPVEVGQQVGPGTNVARVANTARLKAEIKVAETQAKDIEVGQTATIDTRNGMVAGRVARIDPSVQNGTLTVDVSLEGELPRGAVPDLSVDGTIVLERLEDVLYISRPAFAQEHAAVTVFKVGADDIASRVRATLGRGSVTTVEVTSGLQAGDRVILSDMSAWDAYDRVRLR